MHATFYSFRFVLCTLAIGSGFAGLDHRFCEVNRTTWRYGSPQASVGLSAWYDVQRLMMGFQDHGNNAHTAVSGTDSGMIWHTSARMMARGGCLGSSAPHRL